MLNVATISEYRRELEKNRQVLQNILSGALSTAYPHLSKRLCSYSASLGKKLDNILSYAISYGQNEEEFISKADGYRGYECMLSYDSMVKLYGGSCDTWWKGVQMLAALGLLYIHKPDMHDGDDNHSSYGNTPAQEYSLNRARKKSASSGIRYRAVNWYSFPKYTETMLAEVERRAAALADIKMGSIDKDCVRYFLGEAVANIAYDTPFGMSDNTTACREVIRQVVEAQIMERGYTTPYAVLREAYDQTIGEDVEEPETADEDKDIWSAIQDNRQLRAGERSRKRIEKVWNGYRTLLFDEMGLKYSAPTKAEKEAFQLHNGSWIIRRNDVETA